MSHPTLVAALKAVFSHIHLQVQPILSSSSKGRDGDLQCNDLLKLLAPLPEPERVTIKKAVLEAWPLPEQQASISITGPGFINIKLGPAYIVEAVNLMTHGKSFGVAPADALKNVVLDFGGPNIAKQLHVGHLRSFVIGEALQRILRFKGHSVTSDIHFGDWGLQMGKLLLGLEMAAGEGPLTVETLDLASMEKLYLLGHGATIGETEDAKNALQKARKITTKLQNGESPHIESWLKLRHRSIHEIILLAEELGAEFDLLLGESDAHADLNELIDDLSQQGLAIESDNAIVVNLDKGPPLLLKSGEGSVLYGGTDLATVKQRVETLGAEKIVYCVDGRQSEHLGQVFAAWNLIAPTQKTELVHVDFGTVKGKDGKAIKTREGAPVKLLDLIASVTEKTRQVMKDGASEEVVKSVALGALKFADLCSDRQSGYVFDEDRMTSNEGKSGPYLQYACVRIKSILAKSTVASGAIGAPTNEHERQLLLKLLGFEEAVNKAHDELKPHHVADYAFKLAQQFSSFYAEVPVLVDDEAVSSSRLAMCRLTLGVLTQALDFLGIKVPEKM